MKRIKLLLIPILALLLFTGCDVFKVDTMEDIDIITTSYPLEYIVKRLLGFIYLGNLNLLFFIFLL